MEATTAETGSWQQFGLSEDPFAAAASKPFIPGSWRNHLELLQHLCLYSNVLMVLTGLEACGKTTLLQQLKQQDPTLITHTLFADASLDPAELMRNVSSAFSQDTGIDETGSLQDKSQQLINQLKTSEQHHLLIIDDADQLPPQSLELCAAWVQLQNQDDTSLHVLLAGQDQLLEQVQCLEFITEDSSRLHTLELAPLSLSELESYVQYSFALAGFSGEEPLDRETLMALHQNSEGLFGQFAAALEFNEPVITTPAPKNSLWDQYRLPIFAGAGIVLVLIVAYAVVKPFIQSEPNDEVQLTQSTPKTETVQAATQNKLLQKAKLEAAKEKVFFQTTKHASQYAEVTAGRELQRHNNTAPSNESITEDKAPPFLNAPQTRAPNYHPQVAHRYISHPIIKQVLIPVEHETQTAQLDQSTELTAAVEPTDNEIDATAIHATKTNAATQATTQQHLTHKQILAVTQPKPKPVTTHHVTPNSFTKKSSKARLRSNHITSMNPHYFGIQLLGTHSKRALIKFRRQHNLKSHTQFYRTILHGKPWYVLIYGQYSSLKQARRSLKRLPQALRKLHPWIKNYGDIQRSLRPS